MTELKIEGQDVAEPDHVVVKGTGQENNELAWARKHVHDFSPIQRVDRKTEIIGTGVPARKKRPVRKPGMSRAGVPPGSVRNDGDIVFILYDYMDRIAQRQDQKFERIEKRLAELEAWRRLP